ncbi:MAG: hypothetical protein AB8G14_01160 [Ilumatobacter sp.]
MNPQRLVAAVAALAIGFGVTLAGVIVADEDSTASSNQVDEPVAAQDDADDDIEVEETDDVEEADDAGGVEQEEAPAPEPAPAEAEPAVDSDDAESQQPSQEAPSQSPESPPEQPGNQDEAGDEAECQLVYVVVGVDGKVAVLGEDELFLAGDGSVFLPGADVSLDDLSVVQEVSVRVAVLVRAGGTGDVFIDCETEALIEERDPDELIDEIDRILDDVSTGDPTGGGDSGSADAGVSLDFPCGTPLLAAIEQTYIDQFGVDIGSDTDYAIVLVSLAQRVTAVSIEFNRPENDLEFWVNELQGPFVGFRDDLATAGRDIVEACSLLGDNLSPSTQTRDGFFCAVGQLASDDELLEFLDGLVPVAADCAYPNAAAGGVGSILDETDQGDN